MAILFGITLFPFAVWILLILLGIVFHIFKEKPRIGFWFFVVIFTLIFPGLIFIIGAALVIFLIVEVLKWKSGMR